MFTRFPIYRYVTLHTIFIPLKCISIQDYYMKPPFMRTCFYRAMLTAPRHAFDNIWPYCVHVYQCSSSIESFVDIVDMYFLLRTFNNV